MRRSSHTYSCRRGFTLIELSIVLVIIGLIVGGVLVGQDLIKAAEVRAQISQIERYNTAVNTFRGKYGALPGDMNAQTANQFGFSARGPNRGEGDGNGILEGVDDPCGDPCAIGIRVVAGETAMFWVDLSSANGLNVNLVDGTFNTASSTAQPAGIVTSTSTPGIAAYMPLAKLGHSNYVYVYSGGFWNGSTWVTNGINYFGLSAFTDLNAASGQGFDPVLSVTVTQAYAIDKKMDDGMPQTGGVLVTWDGNVYGLYDDGATDKITATPPSATSCYDDGGVTGSTRKYSININGGAGVNCVLSFQFQ